MTASAALAAVDEAMMRPWAWGVADCCTAVCDAFAALHGVDPMAPARGGYGSTMTAARFIAARGGFAAMVESFAASAGLEPVAAAESGALGIVRAGPSMGQLALCIAPAAWAVKSRRGYVVVAMVERGWTWRPR